MSSIAITGGATGTGVFSLLAPSTSTNRTLTLPDSTGTVLNDQSDILTQTKAALNASGSAPVYACRAWVNFNGTGTVVINASGNVSSITDNGTGDYTVNFTTALPDANYALGGFVTNGGAGMCLGIASSASTAAPTTKTTTAVRLSARTTGGGLQDVYDGNVILLR